MLEIDLCHYNEMLRYEKDMDWLRALVIRVTEKDGELSIPGMISPREYVFDVIKHFSRKFAEDIVENSSIKATSMDLFHSSLFSTFRILGISEEDVLRAGEQQRYRNSGFWEMRRCLGQFQDIAEYCERDGVDQIIAAGVSGCIIGEYLGALMSRPMRVDHMIFSRVGTEPVEGFLSVRFAFGGESVLLVDDAVMEMVTSQIMIDKLKKMNPRVQISLFTVDMDEEVKGTRYLEQYRHVYMPEE